MVEAKPRIIVTRQQEQGEPWVRALVGAGLPVLNLPLLRYAPVPVDPALADRAFDWILFASPQGVRAFVAAGLETRGARLGALGTGTARALAEEGLHDDLGIAVRDGRELALAFLALAPEGHSVLLPGPVKRGLELPDLLRGGGYDVNVVNLYQTLPVTADELPADLPDHPESPFAPGDLVFFCSPSAVRAFCGLWDARPDAIAIGEVTAAVTRQEGFATRVADTPDLEAMLRAAGLPHHLNRQSGTPNRESAS